METSRQESVWQSKTDVDVPLGQLKLSKGSQALLHKMGFRYARQFRGRTEEVLRSNLDRWRDALQEGEKNLPNAEKVLEELRVALGAIGFMLDTEEEQPTQKQST